MPNTNPARVLFVHPNTWMTSRTILPLSVPALIKRLPEPAFGCHGSELTDDRIRRGLVFILDIHWYTTLTDAARLARRIKQVNPRAKIVAGGITASLFARPIVERLDIDYVVRGDGEIPLPRLVAQLLGGAQDLRTVPNLVGKGGLETPWDYTLTAADIDENDYLDLDFFPSIQAELRRLHRHNPDWPTPTYPWIVPYRGCPRGCRQCAGGAAEQQKLFRRATVVRSPEKVADDFARLDRDASMRYAIAFLDFLTALPGDYAGRALPRPSRLLIDFDLFDLPEAEALAFLLSRFRGGVIRFPMDRGHATTAEPLDPPALIAGLRQVQQTPGYRALLQYNGIFARQSPVYRAAVKAVLKTVNVGLYDVGFWWTDFPEPGPRGDADAALFDYYVNLPREARFPMLNRKAAFGYWLDRVLPRACTVGLRWLQYHVFQHWRFAAGLAKHAGPLTPSP